MMDSYTSRSRNNSVRLPKNSISSRPYPSHAHVKSSLSSNDTAYNGSEGYIDDSVPYAEQDRATLNEAQIAAPARVVTQSRPALGSRLLSSLSTAQPAASALTRKGSVLHSRAKSLAGFVPKLSPSNTSTPEKTHTPNKIFGDLFHGESAPIRLGAPISPTKEVEEPEFIMDYRSSFTERPMGMSRRSTAQSQTSLPLMNKTTSWFGRRATNPVPCKYQTQDELATLNINTSLFPNGPADPLNPAAFNDLLLNATNLLQRMQTAYKEKVDYISSIQPEMDAQREEVEEVETRSKHLKMQLEEMSHQAKEQETAMQEMGRQLAEEKIKAQEALEAARTVRLVPPEGQEVERTATSRRTKRRSTDTASDSGFESDKESVISGPIDTPISPPRSIIYSYDNDRWQNTENLRGHGALQRRPSTSTMGSKPGSSNPSGRRLGGEGAAWATVDSLRSENQDLRKEMEEMQKTLQGCIDLVSGINGL